MSSVKKPITMNVIKDLNKTDNLTVEEVFTAITQKLYGHIGSRIEYYDKTLTAMGVDGEELATYIAMSCFMKDDFLKNMTEEKAIHIVVMFSTIMEVVSKDCCTDAVFKKLQDYAKTEFGKKE